MQTDHHRTPVPPTAVPARLPPGLTSREAERRLAVHGPNAVDTATRIPWWSRVALQLRDPLILVLLAAVLLTVLTADYADTLIIGFVVVVNTAVGVTQEIRADHAIEALAALSAPAARVVRDASEQRLAVAEVVPGDVLLLGAGDIVAADARLLRADALLVDESTATGESVPVEKSADVETGAEAGALLAGTVVVHGRAVAEVTATGARSTLGQVAALLRPRADATPLQRRLAGLGRVLAAVTVGLSVLVFALGLVRGQGLELMAVTAISLAVAAVPESLPAVVTLSLALGARRMAARHAIVRHLPAVETLGSVTVLATDKTGTLTMGAMLAERVWTPTATAVLTGTGFEPAGTVTITPDTPQAHDAVGAVLRTAAHCNDASLVPPGRGADGTWSALGDPTEAALLVAAAKAGAGLERNPRIAEVPFDAGRRRMTTLHRRPDDLVEVCLKGAPEAVLDPALLADPPQLLDTARAEAAGLASHGYRVLAVAHGLREDVPRPATQAEHRLSLLGLVALDDPPKAAARETVRRCRAAGITPVLITGDHPATARAVADRVGIPLGADGRAVTGRELAAGQVDDPTSVRIFARTSAGQKLDIIRAWQERGAVTAMTGDGVNDGPALRRADIGVAMGHRGSEVARQAADLVLADDELATVVAAVEEGRRVYDNIRRFLLYAMAGGVAEILVMLTGPALGLALPLLAGQILWINLLTHGLTGVAMGAEPASPDTMRRPPRPPQQQVLGDGLWQRVLLLGVVVTAGSLGTALWARHAGAPWQTVLFLALLAAQLGVCVGLREQWPLRRHLFLPLAVLASGLLGAAALYLPPLRELLHTVPLTWGELLPVLAVGTLSALIARLTRRH
ncbi:cation-transporting P-type ATPase [Kitasatospora sp. NPDC002227]|uniref:cation-translocating P-type ATPase n=1 Tax=Kitasatospora sp. NPDC002227 TaxID=3154773 RepID=UPI00332C7D92